jgi:hypothetical protein
MEYVDRVIHLLGWHCKVEYPKVLDQTMAYEDDPTLKQSFKLGGRV